MITNLYAKYTTKKRESMIFLVKKFYEVVNLKVMKQD